MEKIRLEKVVYNKDQFEKTINTSFTQLTSSVVSPNTSSDINVVNDPVNIQLQIDKFFQDYKNLFFNIPKFGNTNSHEYLVKTSSEYIGTSFNDEEIAALTAEIDSLRVELISLTNENLKLLNK
jgi:hypothetical protein